jgi:ABC-type hemin transport system ATPase subunit
MISASNLAVCIDDKTILKGLTLDVLASEMKAVFLSNGAEAFR